MTTSTRKRRRRPSSFNQLRLLTDSFKHGRPENDNDNDDASGNQVSKKRKTTSTSVPHQRSSNHVSQNAFQPSCTRNNILEEKSNDNITQQEDASQLPAGLQSSEQINEPDHVVPDHTAPIPTVLHSSQQIDEPDHDPPISTGIQSTEQMDEHYHAVMSLSENEEDLVSIINEGLRLLVSWENIAAYLQLNTRGRLTKSKYEDWRASIMTASDGSRLPFSYRTIRTTQNEYLRTNCYPTSVLKQCPKTDKIMAIAKRTKTIVDYDKHTIDVRDTIRLILPSEWAKYDLSLYHVYKDIIEGDHHSNPEKLSIEKSPIIIDRPTIIGSSTMFWAKSNNCIVPAPTASTVQFIYPYTNKKTSLYTRVGQLVLTKIQH